MGVYYNNIRLLIMYNVMCILASYKIINSYNSFYSKGILHSDIIESLSHSRLQSNTLFLKTAPNLFQSELGILDAWAKNDNIISLYSNLDL